MMYRKWILLILMMIVGATNMYAHENEAMTRISY